MILKTNHLKSQNSKNYFEKRPFKNEHSKPISDKPLTNIVYPPTPDTADELPIRKKDRGSKQIDRGHLMAFSRTCRLA